MPVWMVHVFFGPVCSTFNTEWIEHTIRYLQQFLLSPYNFHF